MTNLLMLTGNARSGTTILCALMNSHPAIHMTFEFRLFWELNHPRGVYIAALRKQWWKRRIVESTPEQYEWSKKLQSYWFLSRYLWGLRQHSIITLEAMSQVLGTIYPVAYVGDKDPHYDRYLDQYLEMDALRRVVIYRDCRDVVGSMRAKFEIKRSLEEIAANWVTRMQQLAQSQAKVHVIRYENLMTAPQVSVSALAQFLQIDPLGFRTDMLRKTSIGNYRQRLTKAEIDSIQKIAGDTLHQWGYAIEG